MKNLNRDLLLVTKKNELNKTELEQTIVDLEMVLFEAESFSSICLANEVFDLNKFRIYRSIKDVAFYIRNKAHKPFVFVSNKN
jgi:hypothetical protein